MHFSAKFLRTVWRSTCHSTTYYWPSHYQWRWQSFSGDSSTHDQSHYLRPWRNSYSQKHLLLFISRFAVTAKQIFLFFFLPSILFSFLFFLTIWYNIFLPFLRFLWSSITIRVFDVRKESCFFCGCQQKSTLLHDRADNWYSQRTIISNLIWRRGKLRIPPPQNHCHFLNTYPF